MSKWDKPKTKKTPDVWPHKDVSKKMFDAIRPCCSTDPYRQVLNTMLFTGEIIVATDGRVMLLRKWEFAKKPFALCAAVRKHQLKDAKLEKWAKYPAKYEHEHWQVNLSLDKKVPLWTDFPNWERVVPNHDNHWTTTSGEFADLCMANVGEHVYGHHGKKMEVFYLPLGKGKAKMVACFDASFMKKGIKGLQVDDDQEVTVSWCDALSPLVIEHEEDKFILMPRRVT